MTQKSTGTQPMNETFAAAYPHIASWVEDHDSMIEIGYDYNTGTYARAVEEGGIAWGGGEPSATLDELLQSLDEGIAAAMKKIGLSLGR